MRTRESFDAHCEQSPPKNFMDLRQSDSIPRTGELANGRWAFVRSNQGYILFSIVWASGLAVRAQKTVVPPKPPPGGVELPHVHPQHPQPGGGFPSWSEFLAFLATAAAIALIAFGLYSLLKWIRRILDQREHRRYMDAQERFQKQRADEWTAREMLVGRMKQVLGEKFPKLGSQGIEQLFRDLQRNGKLSLPPNLKPDVVQPSLVKVDVSFPQGVSGLAYIVVLHDENKLLWGMVSLGSYDSQETARC